MGKKLEYKDNTLVIRNDFFDDKRIKALRRKEDGASLVLLYLDLCDMGKETDGELFITTTEGKSEYSSSKLAQMIGYSVDEIEYALLILESLGLVFLEGTYVDEPFITEDEALGIKMILI